MNNQPLVSICTSCYNHEKYLDDYFESIINQTYDNIELIFIDDHSKDNSVSKVNMWLSKAKKRFKRVLFIKHNKNKHVCKSYNEAIKEAKGEFIRLVSSDDMIIENCIKDSVEFLLKNQQYNLLCSNGFVVNDNFKYGDRNSKLTKFYPDIYLFKYTKLKGKDLFKNMMIDNFILMPSVMFKKECFVKYGLFDENLTLEDYEYWLRIISKGDLIPYLNKITVYYRVANNSISHDTKNIGRINSKQQSIEKTILKYIDCFKNSDRDFILKINYLKLIKENLKLKNRPRIKYYINKLGYFDFYKELFTNFYCSNILKYYIHYILNIK